MTKLGPIAVIYGIVGIAVAAIEIATRFVAKRRQQGDREVSK